MKTKISSILLVFLGLSLQAQEVFISNGAEWKYLDDGSNQGTAWYGTEFNDENWNSGNAQLGYGDGDEVSTVSYGPSSGNKYPTTYFRKSFDVSDHTMYNLLMLEAIRDDGMVVYLNGTKVWSDNMPATYNYLSYAIATVSDSGEDAWLSQNVSNNLVTGNNVIGVEIHQRSASSSDISFDFKLTAYDELPTEITRGPYLQSGTPNSVILKWRTNIATESSVHYGTSLNALNDTVSENTPTTEHEVLISGLDPNTKYFYEISNSEGVYLAGDSEMYVKTAPEAGTKQFVRAWILGDAGTGNQNQLNVRNRYYNYVESTPKTTNQTDMMLFLGDNAYHSGTDSEYQAAMFDVYSDMLKKSVSWSTLGNHDGYSATSSTQSGPYYDIFSLPKHGEAGGIPSGTEAYYSFDYANIHFIVLESYTLYNSTTQMDWCRSDIQATNQDWIVAIFHHPPYTKGSHNSDTENQLRKMRENFLPILESNGVDLILSGHSHSYERSYFINGHYGTSYSFDATTHTVGSNGHLSGKEDSADGAYTKANTDTKGAVYITTGSAGKISGGSLNHKAMYSSLNQLGSCVLELDNDAGTGQNLTVKFLRDNGSITDYFTINKSDITLSTDESYTPDSEYVKIYPNPTERVLNIQLLKTDKFKNAAVFNTTGELVKKVRRQKIDLSNLPTGMYFIEINTNENSYFKTFLLE